MPHSSKEDIVFQTNSFSLQRSPRPFVSREEGGHLRIFPHNLQVRTINDLTPGEATELIRLEMVVRESLIEAMNSQGVPVVWVNIEDLGNWAFKRNERPILHVHVFGRASTAQKQKWPEAVYLPDRSSGFYDDFEPLNQSDMNSIANCLQKNFQKDIYLDKAWNL